MSDVIVCPLCSDKFDAAVNAACQACPVGAGCPLVCCPSCGYTTVDPAQSMISKLITKTSAWRRNAKLRQLSRPASNDVPELVPLGEVSPGAEVVVSQIAELPPTKRLHVQAYGLAPGRRVRVLQQSPVTVVRADHTELALESDLASAVLVELIG